MTRISLSIVNAIQVAKKMGKLKHESLREKLNIRKNLTKSESEEYKVLNGGPLTVFIHSKFQIKNRNSKKLN